MRRNAPVFDELEAVDENFKIPVHPKSDDALRLIADACQDNTLFTGVSEEQRHALFLAMERMSASPGDLIIKQGEKGDKYYVIESGEYEVLLKQKGDEPVHRYIGQGSFGELALLYQVPRASSVRCAAAGSLWALDRKTFRHALMAHNKLEVDQTARFLQAVEILSPLTDQQRSKLASTLEEISYEDGATLWDVGDKADWLCLIRSGTVVSTSSYREPLTFQVGSFFGTQVTERTLLPSHNPSVFTCTFRAAHIPVFSFSRFGRLAGAQGRSQHEANRKGNCRGARQGIQAHAQIRHRALWRFGSGDQAQRAAEAPSQH